MGQGPGLGREERTDHLPVEDHPQFAAQPLAGPEVFALGEAVSGPGFHAYPVPKGNEDLLAYLNGFITHLYKNGKLAELQKKWFGQHVIVYQ